MKRLPLLLLALVACRSTPDVFTVPKAELETVRHTTSGDVQGGAGHHGTHAWLGIPYAAPPVGALRWRAPQPPASWTETRDALAFGQACTQPPVGLDGSSKVNGSEDCLTVNVWAPAFPRDRVPQGSERLPVMVWIHGGGNSIGSASIYDGAHLASSQKVVVMSVQYRLGPLGWFHHPALAGSDARDASGNYGTLDLIRSLEWVRDNAASFGGDPGNVTIFGESAGGFDVYTLLVSPLAKGLFHKAIAQSGMLEHASKGTAANWLDDEKEAGHKNSSREVVAHLLEADQSAPDAAAARKKAEALTDEQTAKYLRSKSAAELINAYRGSKGFGMLEMPLLIGDGTVLPEGNWTERLATADGWNRVPVMVGTNLEELKLFLFLNPKMVSKKLGFLPRVVDDGVYQATSEAGSRVWKLIGADAPAAAMVKSGATDVFAYRFDWRGQKSRLGTDMRSLIGAAHAVEIPFVFGDFGGPLKRLYEAEDEAARDELSNQMMGYWGRFAREGKPGTGTAGTAPEWKAWDSSSDEAPKFIVLDQKKDGGVRMSSKVERFETIVSDLAADTRLDTSKKRCGVFVELSKFGRTDGEATYGRIAPEVCKVREFSFERYPWPD